MLPSSVWKSSHAIDCQDPYPARLLDTLFVGTYKHAASASVRKQFGITHVLDVEEGGTRPQNLPPNRYMARPMCDFGGSRLTNFLDDCCNFIDAATGDPAYDESGGIVLINCEWGVNRSATVALAYLICRKNMSLPVALAKLLAVRPIVRPRDGYLEQLIAIEQAQQGSAHPLTTTLAELLVILNQQITLH